MTATPRAELLTRGLRLEYLTVGWNIVEGLIEVGAGVAAGSIALIGFGVDSFVETISGALAGLALNALLGWWWADPIAALGIVVLLIREGKEALHGEDDHD